MTNKDSSPVSELVERLRYRAKTMNGSLVGASDGATYALGYYDQFAAKDDKEAADRLTALEAENGRLREVMKPFSKFAGVVFERNFNCDDPVDTMTSAAGSVVRLYARDYFAVRAALTAPQGGAHGE